MSTPSHSHPGRFARQARFAPFGTAGQERWSQLRVGVVGLGGLGSTSAALLARTGVAELRLIDRDIVEESNLPRQTLYDAQDAALGLPKAEAAVQHLRALDGPTRLDPRPADLQPSNADELLGGLDLVVDGLDNFECRYLINDWCARAGVAWVYGGAVASQGAVFAIPSSGQPCLRCVFPEPDEPSSELTPTCDTVGVLSPLPNLIASLQVSEAMRSVAEPQFQPRLWNLDPWGGRALVARSLSPRDDCPACGSSATSPALVAQDAGATVTLCGRGTIQVRPDPPRAIDLNQLAIRWEGLGAVTQSSFLVRLVAGDVTLSAFPDGRVLIQGADDESSARSLYSRYVGH